MGEAVENCARLHRSGWNRRRRALEQDLQLAPAQDAGLPSLPAEATITNARNQHHQK
jgi:hypothetical protein